MAKKTTTYKEPEPVPVVQAQVAKPKAEVKVEVPKRTGAGLFVYHDPSKSGIGFGHAK